MTVKYDYITLDQIRQEVRPELEREHARAYFAFRGATSDEEIRAAKAKLDDIAQRIENINKASDERDAEIDRALNPPPPPEPEPKKKRWGRK